MFSGTKGELDASVDWSNILSKPTLPVKATSTVLGLVELFSDTVQTEAAQAVTTTASRTYGVQLNGNDQMVVNVPWADTNTTYAKATATTLGLVELADNTVQSVAANAVTTTASRTYGIQLNGNDQAVVNVPWTAANNGTLTAAAGTTGATNTNIALNFSTTYSADTATNTTINPVVGPALVNLATLMTTATAGFIRRTGQDTYAVDSSTYLTSYTETDTLATVTGRGATTATAISLTNTTQSTSISTGALIISGGVGIAKSVYVGETLYAASKSFLIPHPTKEGKKLRYGSLEGPENGVYIRGKLKNNNTIELPEYWTKLVDPDSITVSLTPIGNHQNLYVEFIENNKVVVANSNLINKNVNCFFVVYGERIDIDKLVVEL